MNKSIVPLYSLRWRKDVHLPRWSITKHLRYLLNALIYDLNLPVALRVVHGWVEKFGVINVEELPPKFSHEDEGSVWNNSTRKPTWILTIVFEKAYATERTESSMRSVMKWAPLLGQSTTISIVDFPLDRGNATTKSIDSFSQINASIESGWRRPVGFEQSGIATWHML